MVSYRCPRCGAEDSIVVVEKYGLEVREDGTFFQNSSGDVIDSSYACDSCGARFGWEERDYWTASLVPIPGSFAERSADGYPIIYRGEKALVLLRSESSEPYLVAFGYDEDEGNWSWAWWTDDILCAVNRANNG